MYMIVNYTQSSFINYIANSISIICYIDISHYNNAKSNHLGYCKNFV